MSWFRLDDQGAFHEKVLAVGNEAFGAFCRAGQWTSAHMRDGFVPLNVAHMIAPPAVWIRLINDRAGHEVGLVVEAALGYQLHDFLAYNPSRGEVEGRRAQWRERQARGREAQARRLETSDPVTRDTRVSLAGVTALSRRPVPSRPVPIQFPDPDPTDRGSAEGGSAPAAPPPPTSPGRGQGGVDGTPEAPPPLLTPSGPAKPPRRGRKPAAGKHPLPAEWAPDLAARQLAAELGVDVLLEAEKMRAWAAHEGAVGKAWDQRFSNWIRSAAERGRSNGSTGAHKIANVQPTPASGPAWKPKSVTDLRPEAERIARPLDDWGNET